MSNNTLYQPKYENSWALVIGVNEYKHAPKLGCACHDAEAVADALKIRFGFPETNVTLLKDDNASRVGIMAAYLAFANDHVSADDRIVVFFAGHGHTRTGHRGEVGYLVPQEGDQHDLATLIRWDDLTRNAELIPAKHILFLMDACYGGLAITRALAPGSSRFVKDMLQRYSRQVLTAGKADEVVADAGGPRAGHSIFTGHLLDALEGASATPGGIISANAVMAYVYERVANDPRSQQTPHYGFFDGSGDLIFSPPAAGTPAPGTVDDKIDHDTLIQVPATGPAPIAGNEERSLSEQVKDCLSDPRSRIRLTDLTADEIRTALHQIREEEFPVQPSTVTVESFAERLRRYEGAVNRLSTVMLLCAHWGTEDHQAIIEKIVARLAERNVIQGGLTIWLGLRWYPLALLMYYGGISALAARNYRSLATVLTTRVGAQVTGERVKPALLPTVDGMLEVKRTEIFKKLPGHERQYVPESEYLFKALQPLLEDLLFLGSGYEELFDRFEVLQALVYADLESTGSEVFHFWGPPGRFAWKHRSSGTHGPFETLVAEAGQQGGAWPPLHFGLFSGSVDRFLKISAAYRELMSTFNWY